MIHISHGPVGCGQYSRAGRRNYYVGTTGVNTFGTMNFTFDVQEKDIVFGGDKKLTKLIDKIEALFPFNKGISIQSECPIGLIDSGDIKEKYIFQKMGIPFRQMHSWDYSGPYHDYDIGLVPYCSASSRRLASDPCIFAPVICVFER